MIYKIDENTREIKAKEFLHINNITEFYIPKSVEKIGDSAFSVYTDMIPTLQRFTVDKDNPNFDEIDGVLVTKDRKKLVAFPIARSGSYTVPEGIEVIGRYAFRMAIFLEEIIMPDSLESIETDAFYYCSKLKNVDLGGTRKIGIEAFYYCTELENVRGGRLASIGNKAFMKCAKLRRFDFPDTVEKIGTQAFYGCDVASYDWGKGINEIGDKAFVGANISVTVSKEQEKLLREELFAMNDRRKFAVAVSFKDSGRELVLSGKIGSSNIKITDGEFDFESADAPTPKPEKKKTVKKSERDNKNTNEIKPVLIDEITGRACRYNHEIRYNAFGIDDITERRAVSCAFSSVATVDENGFNKRHLSEINEDIVFELESSVMSTGIDSYFLSTFWNVGPYVYLYTDGELLVNLSYFKNKVVFDEKGTGINESETAIFQFWKISRDLKSAVKIEDMNSDEWKFVKRQERLIHTERELTESFIGRSGSVSKEPGEMQKHFKCRYKKFVVPNTEESLSNFFEDSFKNIFNFGYTAVYDESKKGHIGERYRSYLNIYGKDGRKRETVKFKGYPFYIFQREHTYYVVTQQDKSGKTPAKIRLYKFELNDK